MNIEARQSSLLIQFRDKITIAGLGGLGSWVALIIAMSGLTKNIIVYDDDIVEDTNLNRSVFKTSQIGKRKVDAIAEIIKEYRPDVEIYANPEKITAEDISAGQLLVDCTDSLQLFKTLDKKVQYIKGGYDGRAFTIINGLEHNIWDTDNSGYSVISSFVAPCAFMAGIICDLIAFGAIGYKACNKVVSRKSITELFNELK